MKPLILITLTIACWGTYSIPVKSQEPDSLAVGTSTAAPDPQPWQVRGYIKNLQTWIFLKNSTENQFLQDGLLHQRTNLRWTPGPHFVFAADLRTRAFYGDLVRAQPDYAMQIENTANDVADLSRVLLNRPSWVVQTMLDRLYLEYNSDKWELRLGRQRINWGIGNVWNPNDIFNAFAFTDFDYEERPGSDALRVRYFTGFASSVEVAVKAFDRWQEAVAAGLWKFHFKAFDFQILAGYARRDLVLGGGWAGNLGNAGFKGEFSYFSSPKEISSAFAMTAAVDYSTAKNLYLQGGYLYNSQGAAQGSADGIFAFQLSAKNLYPYRHALFLQAAYPFTPLINGGLAAIYSPVQARALFVNPVITISAAPDWDLDIVGQIVAGREANGGYRSPLQAFFIRTKYSF